ncbi:MULTISPECIES: hypothetical protein [unclassified Haladaptatus]|uniref:hypothetical protein n=1 Tax=unclassified Haladaptatus TaxID=2622732 RepID=UPI0023E82CB8|nr:MULTISPECIES: hypothetical protein [unclassified Haladaptatus]
MSTNQETYTFPGDKWASPTEPTPETTTEPTRPAWQQAQRTFSTTCRNRLRNLVDAENQSQLSTK